MQLPEICIKRPGLRDGAVADHPARRGDLVHAALRARVPAHRRAGGQRVDAVPRRLRRGRRVADHQGARGFARRHRRRRDHDVAEPLGAQPDQRPLLAQARPGLGRRRRARQGVARARQDARHRRRAGDRQGRGRLVPGHLHRRAVGRRARCSRRPTSSSATSSRACRCCPARPTCASSASARCRCASTSTARGSPRTGSPCRTSRTRSAGRTRRSPPGASRARRASSPSSPRPTCARRSSSTTSSSPTSAAIRCASATSATSYVGAVDERVISRYNGKPSLNIGVIKQAVANPLELSKAVRAEVDAINENLPAGMKLIVAYDTSVFIDRSIKSVFETIAEAIGLVVLVIFFFLRSLRATVIPIVTIPVSLIGAFGLMYVVRLHDQHADAAGDGARDRPRRRRCDRDAGEHLPPHRGGACRAGRRRSWARARSASRSSP